MALSSMRALTARTMSATRSEICRCIWRMLSTNRQTGTIKDRSPDLSHAASKIRCAARATRPRLSECSSRRISIWPVRIKAIRSSTAATINAVSHSPRMICRPIVTSSIHGTGAQKWRANLRRGWIGSSTTAFGPNSARRDAAWADDRPESSERPCATVSCEGMLISTALHRLGGQSVQDLHLRLPEELLDPYRTSQPNCLTRSGRNDLGTSSKRMMHVEQFRQLRHGYPLQKLGRLGQFWAAI